MAIKYADGRMRHYPVDLISMKVHKEFGTHRPALDELQLALGALAEIEEGME